MGEQITISCIKADIGGIGGHTCPSQAVLERVKKIVAQQVGGDRLLIDAYVGHCGDDIHVLMTHTHSVNNSKIHQFMWDTLNAGADVAKKQGLYGAGQDLHGKSFSGNIKGMGPGYAEMEIVERENEPFVFFAMDKTEPGAFNLPLYLGFADPMFLSGILVSPVIHQGFTFVVQDVEFGALDKTIRLQMPEDLYSLAVLLRQPGRFVIKSIWSRAFPNEQTAVLSTERLRNIENRYVGKDDPVGLVRVQKIFPATEELLPAFSIGHYVAGDARGAHYQPLKPVAPNTVADPYRCMPMVQALAFSMKEGKLTEPVDLFNGSYWDGVRRKVDKKSNAMTQQGFFEPAMLPLDDLEYGDINEILDPLIEKFV